MPTPTMMCKGKLLLFVDWQSLTKFSLCVNDTQLIQVNIAEFPSMFEQLLEGSCTDAGDDVLENKNATCP